MIFIFSLIFHFSKAKFVQVFNDNFENLDNWVAENFSGEQSGNSELEYYTNRSVNVRVGPSHYGEGLILEAQFEKYEGYNYTSGKVHSAKQWGPYGFFNVKALVPKGPGLWPAIWMLPTGGKNIYGTWAACGEIDILETVCETNPAYSTLHFGGPFPNNTQYPLPPNNIYPLPINWSVPHSFGVEWNANNITFWFDASIVQGNINGTKVFEIPSQKWYSENSSGNLFPGNAPFNVPTNIVLNLAVGGNWPCSVPLCCDDIVMPVSMIVFNVQIWNHTSIANYVVLFGIFFII